MADLGRVHNVLNTSAMVRTLVLADLQNARRLNMTMAISETVTLCCQLIARPSLTPDDAGCQALISERLAKFGFMVEAMPGERVSNLWLRRGSERPLFVFAGHTDVVPTGPLEKWCSPPFEPTLREGKLYGRGAADMKGGLAAIVTACEAFVMMRPDHKGSLALLITSDEEGPSIEGTAHVIRSLEKRGEQIDWCLVAEPSSDEQAGDVIKNGRRGSLDGVLRIHGHQGHVAHPHRANNPIHRFAPALAALVNLEWDRGSADFPPTTFQISNIIAGTGANNVIPGELDIMFNFRYSTAVTQEELKERVRAVLDAQDLHYDIGWKLSGQPFLTAEGELIAACKTAIHEVTGFETRLSTAGGTSDGRFIAPTGAQVVELGPVNASIHKIDEYVRAADLDVLSNIYTKILVRLLT
jgi:succinyl-diaminopimelate desuccinylase